MTYETLLVSKAEGIGRIHLNRPKQFNTFSSVLATELNAALAAFGEDDEVRVVIVKGEGKLLSTGIDITEFKGKTPLEYHQWISLMDRMHLTIAKMRIPVITAAHGYAVANGAGLLGASDFAIVAEGTQIGTTAINIGLLCTGPVIPFSYAIGKQKVMEMLLCGDFITADEAWRLGLINQVVPLDKLDEAAELLAKKILAKSGVAVALGKKFVYDMLNMPFDQRFAMSADVFARVCTTEDAQEGVSAFLEKRKPQWKHR